MEEEGMDKALEGEISRFLTVWFTVVVSLSYCYFTGKILPKPGALRLAAVTPVVLLFLYLPLQLRSVNLAGVTSFFIAWLANFNLLMFSSDKGPLSAAEISLPRFIAVACLPIKLRDVNRDPLQKGGDNPNFSRSTSQKTIGVRRFLKNESLEEKRAAFGEKKSHRVSSTSCSKLIFWFKAGLILLLVKIYDYAISSRRGIRIVLYCLHIYLSVEVMLAVSAAVVTAVLAAELEPQFVAPYRSTSLQDFWGRRWNVTVSRTLRPSVFVPARRWWGRVVGDEAARVVAVMVTFVVSGLMHELVLYYMGRVCPSWEITWFFVIHGGCLAVEIAVKRKVGGRWRIPAAVSAAMTIGLVAVTGLWLFVPPFVRAKVDEKAMSEIAAVGACVRHALQAMKLMVNQ